ncbi:PEP-CTERM sorting domain-containing protein [Alteromonas aestuariivivens]|uniref:PEP-CTERM sorting domain-containing protein n=1 Tax=Alteromonas aestuariivivens TaxID=1938339 RepID=A0A3D8MF21_9ALTE|nr:PEP-CTERM sorting domain-containing protein [Alteromonas aestuariivivens]RDV29161.1 PEP-CTERM sorting domain-containing protein [Alteromonas aestuariivivens]
MKFLKGCCLGFGLLLGASANAAIITFDFSGPGGNQLYDSLTFNSGGYTLTVTGRASYMGEKVDGVKVEQFTQGLGVYSGFSDDYKLDDTPDLQETLFFKLTSDGDPDAKFSWVEIFFGSKWASQLEDGDGAQVRFGYPHTENFVDGPADSAEFDLDGFSTLIDIQPDSDEGDNGFRVQKISIDVPVPASIGLFMVGLLGLSARRLFSKK